MQRFTLEVSTDGNNDVVNLNPILRNHIRDIRGDGLLHLFVAGSTAALTTIEFEPGLVKHDLPAFFQRLIPDSASYEHEATWNDDNGHSHLRSSLLGPGITVPIGGGRILTGEYQQIVLVDFDTHPRRRTIIATVLA